MDMRRGLVFVVVLSGCGGGSEPPPLENASVCSAGWQPLGLAQPYDITSPLIYRDGTLYYSTFTTRSIMALPVTGGPATELTAATFTDELWLEGDQLLFTGGELGHEVYSMPVSGGTPQLIMDGAAGRTDKEWVAAMAITPTEIFWTEGSPGRLAPPTSVWRASRGGGSPSQLATTSAVLPSGDVMLFDKIAVAPNAVVLASILGLASAVPLDGSPLRSLATVDSLTRGQGDFVGIDAAGVYWSVPKAGAPEENDEWVVALAPVDGSQARTFWQGLPAHSGVRDMWPDGAGGWVVVASQRFDDNRFHATVWLIDANGDGRRLACSPDSPDREPYVKVRPALASDAVYLIDSASRFQIVRVAR